MKLSKKILLITSLITSISFSQKISNIDIKNLKDVTPEYIKENINIKVGDEYSNKLLSDLYKDLSKSQVISGVLIEPKQNGEDVDIVISIDENPNAKQIIERNKQIEESKHKTEFLIDDIKIIGLKNADVSSIINDSKLKKGEYLVPYDVEEMKANLAYTGYFKDVKSRVERSAEDKNVNIIFEVEENPIVKSLSISGSQIFLESQLIDASKIEVGKVLNLNYINPDTMPLLSLYKNSGVMSVAVSNLNISEDGDVYIELSEGKIGDVTFSKSVQRKDNERRNSDKYRLKTKSFIFDRVNYLKTGKILTEQAVNSTISELYKTGLFTSIVPNFTQNPDGSTNINFEVVERPTTSINGGISYTSTEGVLGSIKLQDSNFLGTDQDVAINFEFGTRGNFTGEFSYYDPWIKGTDRIQAGTNISFSRQRGKEDEFKSMRDYAVGTTSTIDSSLMSESEKQNAKKVFLNKEYIKYVYNFSGTIGKGIYNNVYVTLRPKIKGVVSYNYEGQKLKDYTLISVSPTITYDSRDNSFTPKKGLILQITDELGYVFRNRSITYNPTDTNRNTTLGTNEDTKDARTGLYNKIEADLRFYHPVFKDKNSMAYHINLGYSVGAIQENFSNSDGATFRGIQTSFTGNEKAIFSVENRTYISDYVQAILFMDFGTIYTSDKRSEAWQFKNINKSFGAGVRITTPIGVIRLDYGWPIEYGVEAWNQGYKVGKGRISFGFGQTF